MNPSFPHFHLLRGITKFKKFFALFSLQQIGSIHSFNTVQESHDANLLHQNNRKKHWLTSWGFVYYAWRADLSCFDMCQYIGFLGLTFVTVPNNRAKRNVLSGCFKDAKFVHQNYTSASNISNYVRYIYYKVLV